MKFAVLRLAAVAGLFVCWLGYLVYLVAVTPRDPVILCRPQFLVADLVVIAQVPGADKPVTVEEVPFALEGDKSSLAGKQIQVTNLLSCAPPRHLWKVNNQKDFTGPDTYILPLRKLPGNGTQVAAQADALPRYEVAATPPAPGYPAPGPPMAGPPRIYPATPEARFQLEQINKSRKMQP